jgi:glutaredoxin
VKRYLSILILILLPVLVFAQNANTKKKAYFFYLDACPHCHNVNDYFNANGIYDKYDIVKLDASAPQNGELLMKFYETNNYPENQRGGVPVVVFGDKFLVGDTPIIDNFVTDIEASQSADKLPNPNSDGSVPDVVVHEGQIGEQSTAAMEQSPQPENAQGNASEGNKKSPVPVIVGVLVLIGAGALIFINREK